MISVSLLKKLNALPFLDITLENGHNVLKLDIALTLELLMAQKCGKQIQRKVKGEWTDCRINPNDVMLIHCFRVKP